MLVNMLKISDFKTELLNLMNEEIKDDDNLCKITGLELNNYHVTLECGHKFNYEAIYKDLCMQKYAFGSFWKSALNSKQKKILYDLKQDYFIKCPFCRNTQFTLLPYYPELGLDKKYGINCTERNEKIKKIIDDACDDFDSNESAIISTFFSNTISKYGKQFGKGGQCCAHNKQCQGKKVTTIDGTELTYCIKHYCQGLREYKQKQKYDLIEEKEKQLNEINTEREKNGLKPLKRLPYKKDENGCQTLITSGKNKGKICGCKKLIGENCCKRHKKI